VAPEDGGYLAGDGVTIADLAVAGPFANFRHTQTRVSPDLYPRTIAYVDRILARPSLATWVERETAMLAK
jgi:glutathione S-transferase